MIFIHIKCVFRIYSANDGTKFCANLLCICAMLTWVFWFLYTSIAALVFAFTGQWFLAGNVWVFSAQSKVQHSDPTLHSHCDRTLYLYSFRFIIVLYILQFIYGIIFCCASLEKLLIKQKPKIRLFGLSLNLCSSLLTYVLKLKFS